MVQAPGRQRVMVEHYYLIVLLQITVVKNYMAEPQKDIDETVIVGKWQRLVF
jgi:hypothetical protein